MLPICMCKVSAVGHGLSLKWHWKENEKIWNDIGWYLQMSEKEISPDSPQQSWNNQIKNRHYRTWQSTVFSSFTSPNSGFSTWVACPLPKRPIAFYFTWPLQKCLTCEKCSSPSVFFFSFLLCLVKSLAKLIRSWETFETLVCKWH